MRFLYYILTIYVYFAFFVNIDVVHAEEVPINTGGPSEQHLERVILSKDFAIIVNTENNYKN